MFKDIFIEVLLQLKHSLCLGPSFIPCRNNRPSFVMHQSQNSWPVDPYCFDISNFPSWPVMSEKTVSLDSIFGLVYSGISYIEWIFTLVGSHDPRTHISTDLSWHPNNTSFSPFVCRYAVLTSCVIPERYLPILFLSSSNTLSILLAMSVS